VIAGGSPEQASPLLGFPVLNQAGRFTIDTKNRQLIFDYTPAMRHGFGARPPAISVGRN
jgi:hypothetical protein